MTALLSGPTDSLAMLARQARRSVAGKTLAEVEEEREGARRIYRLVSKVVLDEDDQARMEAAVITLDTLDKVRSSDATQTAPRPTD